MNLNDLFAACPGVDFSIPCDPYDPSYSIGDYVIEYLQKTFAIIKSSPDIKNVTIVKFAKAEIKDNRLPYTKEYLTQNLKCTDTAAEAFLLAQSAFFAVSFEPQEYKNLGLLDFTPFVVDSGTKIRLGGFGMVEKVFEGDKAFARKTINDNFNQEKINMERKILQLATETGNPHLTHLRCAYKQNDRTCLVIYPWCEVNLHNFLESPHDMAWWTQLAAKERLILITNWMACLASGLSALHKQKIKHQDLKPENILLDANILPVICDFGPSKAFVDTSKCVNVHGTHNYMPPEQPYGMVGRKGDIFSLGLVFLDLVLRLFGHKRLKEEFTGTCFSEIALSSNDFLVNKFPTAKKAILNTWNDRFQSLIRRMLEFKPENRPKASEVWEKAKEMVEGLGANAHCENVSSPVVSIASDHEEPDDDTEPTFIENTFDCADNEVW